MVQCPVAPPQKKSQKGYGPGFRAYNRVNAHHIHDEKFSTKKPFHLNLLFSHHLSFPPDLFSICLITNLLILPHSFYPFSSSLIFPWLHLSTSFILCSVYLITKIPPNQLIISCGGVHIHDFVLYHFPSLVHFLPYTSTTCIFHLSFHFLIASPYSLFHLIRFFIGIPHSLFCLNHHFTPFVFIRWTCLHLALCIRCFKHTYIRIEFIRYPDILIHTCDAGMYTLTLNFVPIGCSLRFLSPSEKNIGMHTHVIVRNCMWILSFPLPVCHVGLLVETMDQTQSWDRACQVPSMSRLIREEGER